MYFRSLLAAFATTAAMALPAAAETKQAPQQAPTMMLCEGNQLPAEDISLMRSGFKVSACVSEPLELIIPDRKERIKAMANIASAAGQIGCAQRAEAYAANWLYAAHAGASHYNFVHVTANGVRLTGVLRAPALRSKACAAP